MMFGFYRFRAGYGCDPVDMDDYFTGLAALNAMQEIEGLPWQKT
jgi:hypothetical protein